MTSTPSGHRVTIDGLDSVAFDRTFRAGIGDVWAAVTESDRLARWIGEWTGDPATGSVDFRMLYEGDEHQAEVLTIQECQAPRRLVLISRVPGEEVVWHMTLTLVEHEGATTLTFTQSVGDDPAMAGGVGPGWDYYLDRLVAAETGGDPASVDFGDYHPVHTQHYLDMFS
ncbi:SRPBCC family protein [Streptomyces globisporus]|uniref:SRPBCC family protein n=2 Tax=Streptomyces globisporus TaxID=1908 RepID=UPI00345F4C81|nr:SRPBCC family protein [Streptomyces globisporus]WSU85031.1 SRPBCC family protein [Streptomyces globisporus]